MSAKIGMAPGTLLYLGEKRDEKVTVTIMDYDKENLHERQLETAEECFPYRDTSNVTWINVSGIHDVDIIEKIGKHFNLHPLELEDIINTTQRPKIEEFEDHIFIIVKMLSLNPETLDFDAEQVSLILGQHYVISFQEREGDVLDLVRHRIKTTVPRDKFLVPGYLSYALVDAIVDHYFLILENIGEKVESLEDELIENPQNKDLQLIHDLKRKLVFLRKSVWPLREVVSGWERLDTPLIGDRVHKYLRDLYEHTIQVIDALESFREMVSGLLDIYLSSISNRMNEVMKVLTIIATIFIPLGFLAGVFGMNFDPGASPFNMPELGFRYGYPMFWVIALLIGGGLFWFFKRKDWL